MPDDVTETRRRGTRDETRKRKPKWPRRLLKGAFWTIWAIEKLFRLITWIERPPDG